MKFKTMKPMMLVGGPKKLRSGEDGVVETDDPKQIAWLKAHPYCRPIDDPAKAEKPKKEFDDGAADKRGAGGEKGRYRRPTGEAD